ncbi:MAG TPA: hypothetical protein VFM74_07645 [Candidatus Limnocylindria bacterium]|nr:hypothetical protein [Candidatus Limnocylindria bacterium]
MGALRSRSWWIGLLLIIGGTVWFLDAWNVVRLGPAWAAVLFGLGGIGFGVVWARERESWWAAIPAGVLLGLAGVIVWEEYGPSLAEEWAGAIFLAGIGIGFLAVYLRDHQRWWALIPGGIMTSTALLVGATTVLPEMQAAAVLIGGMALTFVLVAVLPGGAQPRRWALIPAFPLGIVAIALAVGSTDALKMLEYVWPIILIGGGVFVVWRAAEDRNHGRQG